MDENDIVGDLLIHVMGLANEIKGILSVGKILFNLGIWSREIEDIFRNKIGDNLAIMEGIMQNFPESEKNTEFYKIVSDKMEQARNELFTA